jgi:hypothetical protein
MGGVYHAGTSLFLEPGPLQNSRFDYALLGNAYHVGSFPMYESGPLEVPGSIMLFIICCGLMENAESAGRQVLKLIINVANKLKGPRINAGLDLRHMVYF